MEEKPRRGAAITSLVFGILSMVCCCIGFPFAIIGLILAIVVITKHKAGKGLAIAGLITSIITLIISTWVAISIAPYKNDIVDYYQNLPQYAEEYQEDGSFPPFYEHLISDGKMTEEQAQQFMDMIASSAEQAG